jgi:hypothetical protein
MQRLGSIKPSPAMVVAVLALFVALGGTAVAAFGPFKGDKIIKMHSLSGNRLKKRTVTGQQIKVSSLPKVPSATNADNATHASSADNATHASSADNTGHASNADNATHATSADQLGGQPASSFEGKIEWALVGSDGSVIQQSGGISAVENLVVGAYRVTFPDDVSAKGFSVSLSYKNTTEGGTPLVAPCNGPGEVADNVCGASAGDGHVAGVVTPNTSNSSAVPHAFYIEAIP